MENKINRNAVATRLMDGGYFMLVIFGLTICAMAFVSLLALVFMRGLPETTTTAILRIMDTTIGFIGGSYSTMWNNLHYRQGDKNGNGNGNGHPAPAPTEPPATIAPKGV